MQVPIRMVGRKKKRNKCWTVCRCRPPPHQIRLLVESCALVRLSTLRKKVGLHRKFAVELVTWYDIARVNLLSVSGLACYVFDNHRFGWISPNGGLRHEGNAESRLQ